MCHIFFLSIEIFLYVKCLQILNINQNNKKKYMNQLLYIKKYIEKMKNKEYIIIVLNF